MVNHDTPERIINDNEEIQFNIWKSKSTKLYFVFEPQFDKSGNITEVIIYPSGGNRHYKVKNIQCESLAIKSFTDKDKSIDEIGWCSKNNRPYTNVYPPDDSNSLLINIFSQLIFAFKKTDEKSNIVDVIENEM